MAWNDTGSATDFTTGVRTLFPGGAGSSVAAMATKIETLGDLRAHGYELRAYCEERECRHTRIVDHPAAP